MDPLAALGLCLILVGRVVIAWDDVAWLVRHRRNR